MIMETIYKGTRWEQSEGDTFVHWGRLDYLRNIGATPDMSSGKCVPSTDIDGAGRYQPSGRSP